MRFTKLDASTLILLYIHHTCANTCNFGRFLSRVDYIAAVYKMARRLQRLKLKYNSGRTHYYHNSDATFNIALNSINYCSQLLLSGDIHSNPTTDQLMKPNSPSTEVTAVTDIQQGQHIKLQYSGELLRQYCYGPYGHQIPLRSTTVDTINHLGIVYKLKYRPRRRHAGRTVQQRAATACSLAMSRRLGGMLMDMQRHSPVSWLSDTICHGPRPTDHRQMQQPTFYPPLPRVQQQSSARLFNGILPLRRKQQPPVTGASSIDTPPTTAADHTHKDLYCYCCCS